MIFNRKVLAVAVATVAAAFALPQEARAFGLDATVSIGGWERDPWFRPAPQYREIGRIRPETSRRAIICGDFGGECRDVIISLPQRRSRFRGEFVDY
jgi:hypothetical protein